MNGELDQELVAVDVRFTNVDFTVLLSDGRRIVAPLDDYPRFFEATPSERSNWQMLGGGYAIEWPDLDEHIGVGGLLAGYPSGESEQSLGRWCASR